jgi:hypothetical protein
VPGTGTRLYYYVVVRTGTLIHWCLLSHINFTLSQISARQGDWCFNVLVVKEQPGLKGEVSREPKVKWCHP